MHRTIAIVALALLPVLAAQAATAPASPSVYEVEVVVFESRMPELEGSELWTWSNGKKTAAEPAAVAAPPMLAGSSELSAAVTALQSDPRYRVLIHQRWVQAAEAKTASKPVLVRSNEREIDGTVLFYMNRFLHLELDLGFQTPRSSAIAAPEPSTPPYRINEQRRVKSQELHYFDHPKFGALVRIVPASPAVAASP